MQIELPPAIASTLEKNKIILEVKLARSLSFGIIMCKISMIAGSLKKRTIKLQPTTNNEINYILL